MNIEELNESGYKKEFFRLIIIYNNDIIMDKLK